MSIHEACPLWGKSESQTGSIPYVFLESISNAKLAMVVCILCIGQNLLINLIIITLLSKAPLTAIVQQLRKPSVFILNNCACRQIFRKLEDSTSSISVFLLNWRVM